MRLVKLGIELDSPATIWSTRCHLQIGLPPRLGSKGERLVPTAPHGHWRTTTLVAGLRNTGLIAPLVLDGRFQVSSSASEQVAEQVHVALGPSSRASCLEQHLGTHVLLHDAVAAP